MYCAYVYFSNNMPQQKHWQNHLCTSDIYLPHLRNKDFQRHLVQDILSQRYCTFVQMSRKRRFGKKYIVSERWKNQGYQQINKKYIVHKYKCRAVLNIMKRKGNVTTRLDNKSPNKQNTKSYLDGVGHLLFSDVVQTSPRTCFLVSFL